MVAYNEVKPRLSLSGKDEDKNEETDYKDPKNWPDSMKSFINRMFTKANELKFNGKQKAKLQTEMKSVINLAISKKEVLTNDWANQDLPCLNTSIGKVGLASDLSNTANTIVNTKANGKAAAKPASKSIPAKDTSSVVKTAKKPGLKIKGISSKNILHDGAISEDDDDEDDYDPAREFASENTPVAKPSTKRTAISKGIESALPHLKKMKKSEDSTLKSAKIEKQTNMLAIGDDRRKNKKETSNKAKAKQNTPKAAKSGVLKLPESGMNPLPVQSIPVIPIMNNNMPLGIPFLNPIGNNNMNDNSFSMIPVINGLTEQQRIQMRGQRFEKELSAPYEADLYRSNDLSNLDNGGPLIGTSQKLEKSYLRLTSQPNPEVVRPLHILKQTLQLLIRKYLEGAKYTYLCDQFKSMRQDLTVQHIKNGFTILVYEYHCRLAIEFNDLGEFNQCQSQLKLLYDDEKLTGEINLDEKLEFLSYRVLYYIITNNTSQAYDLKYQLLSLQENTGTNLLENEFLKNSFQILEYKINSDYFEFFNKVREIKNLDNLDTDEMSDLNHKKRFYFLRLLSPIIIKERINSLSIIAKSYRLISTSFLETQLYFGYDSNDSSFEEFIEHYKLNEFIMTDSNGGKFYEGHKSKLVVDSIRQKMFSKIDIKGQL